MDKLKGTAKLWVVHYFSFGPLLRYERKFTACKVTESPPVITNMSGPFVSYTVPALLGFVQCFVIVDFV